MSLFRASSLLTLQHFSTVLAPNGDVQRALKKVRFTLKIVNFNNEPVVKFTKG